MSVRIRIGNRCGRIAPPLTVERKEYEPEHVRRRQQRRQCADRPQQAMTLDERLEQDLVLAEEP
jgi:hypothetical protein